MINMRNKIVTWTGTLICKVTFYQVYIKFLCASEVLWWLVKKTGSWAPLPDYSDFLGPWWGPKVCIFNMFPGGVNATGLGTMVWDSLLLPSVYSLHSLTGQGIEAKRLTQHKARWQKAFSSFECIEIGLGTSFKKKKMCKVISSFIARYYSK